ncbi:MAG: DUF4417 domain-containing protein [Chlorobium sp.]|nr:DUF4417 domain-containing protein [Chlorobium sp.]
MEKVNYRYKMELPPLPNYSYFMIRCPFDFADWEKTTWSRFGSGGSSDARHCFVDDWRLEHLWRRAGQGLAKAICNGVMTAPDFTIEFDFPQEVALFQVYRSNLLAYYWLSNSVVTVPVLQWGDSSTFWMSPKYIGRNSVVAVRGPGKGKIEFSRWMAGAEHMQTFLKPSLVLHFGRKVPGVWENALFTPLHSRKH